MKSSTTFDKIISQEVKAALRAMPTKDALKARKSPEEIAELRTELGTELRLEILHRLAAEQKEHYNHCARHESAWRARYKSIADVTAGINNRRAAKNLIQDEWAALGNTRFRRFQEAFCDPQNMCFLRDKSRLAATGEGALAGTCVSPDQIPDKLAQDLGLLHFDEDESPEDMLFQKAAPEVIAGLKFIFESARPLARNNERIIYLPTQPDSSNSFYPGATIAAENEGVILYTREINRGAKPEDPFKPRKISVQFFRDAYDARDKTSHVQRQYQRELLIIDGFKNRMEILDKQFQGGGPQDSPAAQQRNIEALAVLKEALDYLENCANQYKVRAQELLASIRYKEEDGKIIFIDRAPRPRPNLLPVWTILTTTAGLLRSREEEIFAKDGATRSDADLMTSEVRSHEARIEAFAPNLSRTIRFFSDRLGLFSGRVRPNHPTHVKSVLSKLEIDAASLERGIKLRPFNIFASKLQVKHKKLTEALTNGDLEGAKDSLLEIHVILKFYRINKAFAQMKSHSLMPDDIKLASLRRFTRQIRKLAESREVFPAREIDGYRQPFDGLLKHLRLLERALEQREKQRLSPKEKVTLLKKLTKFLDDASIPETVRNLP